MAGFDDPIAAPGTYVAKPVPPFVWLWGAGTIWGAACGMAAAGLVVIALVSSNPTGPWDIGRVLAAIFVGGYLYGMFGALAGAILGTATGLIAGLVFTFLRGRVDIRTITPATVVIVVAIQIGVEAWAFGPDLVWIGLLLPVIAVGPLWWVVLKVARDTADDTMDA